MSNVQQNVSNDLTIGCAGALFDCSTIFSVGHTLQYLDVPFVGLVFGISKMTQRTNIFSMFDYRTFFFRCRIVPCSWDLLLLQGWRVTADSRFDADCSSDGPPLIRTSCQRHNSAVIGSPRTHVGTWPQLFRYSPYYTLPLHHASLHSSCQSVTRGVTRDQALLWPAIQFKIQISRFFPENQMHISLIFCVVFLNRVSDEQGANEHVCIYIYSLSALFSVMSS